MLLLDFKCPICGGTVKCDLSYGSGFASMDFRCNKCGEWIDVDITDAAGEALEEAWDYFEGRVEEIEGEHDADE